MKQIIFLLTGLVLASGMPSQVYAVGIENSGQVPARNSENQRYFRAIAKKRSEIKEKNVSSEKGKMSVDETQQLLSQAENLKNSMVQLNSTAQECNEASSSSTSSSSTSSNSPQLVINAVSAKSKHEKYIPGIMREKREKEVPAFANKIQEVISRAREIVREHSGKEWKSRYDQLYFLMFVREKLEALMLEDVVSEFKQKAIRSVQSLLEENGLWPLPMGKDAQQWLDEVAQWKQELENKGDPAANDKMIAVIQKELILSVSDRAPNISRIKILRRWFRESGNLESRESRPLLLISNSEARRIGLPAIFYNYPYSRRQAISYAVRDTEVDPARRVSKFALSSTVGLPMNLAEANSFCERQGARLPTLQEYEALYRAMDDYIEGGGSGYNADLIPGMVIPGAQMESRLFWSSTTAPHGYGAYAFDGSTGRLEYIGAEEKLSVRCARTLQP